ncbi:sigma-70 family RNA polymerase sigma factor [uncultured Azohydromonas sp.]|jgi:RNA polymerase sigma factor, sigma-70 family|uniref:sigma-70 family RNA polymerase sigma factor n=1 Tax=uncultured Azohydromonas sp. TaxID=487342 RepID=UPI00261A09F9|nr:sigma-70 family RNA polymerase sigma factor [uncultured Azohydromonas sp.]
MVLPMHGVPSALIARNESWVRKQAQALVRHLPANVEKADLIQVGLIAVAQAALSFEWEGDRDTEEAKEAFVRYARMRVKGAMLDELRQMDHLGRGQRRKVKIIQIARERWRATNGGEPTLAQLSKVCGLSVEEISALEMLDQAGRMRSTSGPDSEYEEHHHEFHPATEKEEVEARVDTSIVMRHLEKFFAQLPERDRQVIDSYLGVGMSPVELAASLKVTPSRVSQLYKSVLQRISTHFGHQPGQSRAADRVPAVAAKQFDELVVQREKELENLPTDGPWGELIENVLTKPKEQFGAPPDDDGRISVSSSTRWG